jgi:hypothetical protein
MVLELGVGVLIGSALVTSDPDWPGEGLATQASSACTAIAEPSRRLELSDGRIVSIDVQSVARTGESVIAVGRYAYVFPRHATSTTSPQLADSILGVRIDRGGAGRISLLANPVAPRRVLHSRVVAMPDGKVHLLYATHDAEGLRTHTDTATLWLATLRGNSWSTPSVVAVVRTATLDRASALIQHGSELVFVYPFRDDRRHNEDGGVVLLRQRQGRWSADTLRTETEPTSVSAVSDSARGSIVVAFAVADRLPPLLAQRLLLARFGSSWSQPEAIAGDGLTPVVNPSLAVQKGGLVASWLAWPGHDPTNGSLRWLQVDATGRATLRSVIDSGKATFPFEFTVMNDIPLWLYHGEPFGTTVKLMTSRDSMIARLPDVKAEFENPSTRTIALSGTRVLVFTQQRARTETEPMAASFTTALEIRCPRTAQR